MNCNQLLNRQFFHRHSCQKKATWKGVKSVEITLTYLHWPYRLIFASNSSNLFVGFNIKSHQKEKRIWYWKFSKNRYYKSGPRPHIYEAECCNCWICQNCTDVQLVRSNLTGILTYLVVTHDGGIGATWFQKLKLFTASHQKLMIFHFRLMFQQFSTLELRNMFDWPNQVWYTCGPFSSSDADKDDRVKC